MVSALCAGTKSEGRKWKDTYSDAAGVELFTLPSADLVTVVVDAAHREASFQLALTSTDLVALDVFAAHRGRCDLEVRLAHGYGQEQCI
jgi:hypothetical protein